MPGPSVVATLLDDDDNSYEIRMMGDWSDEEWPDIETAARKALTRLLANNPSWPRPVGSVDLDDVEHWGH